MIRNESLLLARRAGRLEERERIARELHDTLLQGTQGLILQIQSVAGRLPPQHPTRKQIELALDEAGDLLGETRAKVMDLRSSANHSDIGSSIAKAAELLAARTTIGFTLELHGEPRQVRPCVAAEIYAIAREALSNAFTHSRANNVRAILSFNDASLIIGIIDDGRGFDSMHGLQRTDSCHFGILGMRERADELGAQLLVASRKGFGTKVEFAIHASLAYTDLPIPDLPHKDFLGVIRPPTRNVDAADGVSQLTGKLCALGPSNESAHRRRTRIA
jgi:signal transduction histidine kinase